MPITDEKMVRWCRTLLGAEAAPQRTLGDYLKSIPRLSSLSNVPSGTVVLVRGDVDSKPGAKIGEGDQRLRSMVDTLRFGIEHGWKQVVFGHIGRKPEGSLSKVAGRLGELLGKKVTLDRRLAGRTDDDDQVGSGEGDCGEPAGRCFGTRKYAAI